MALEGAPDPSVLTNLAGEPRIREVRAQSSARAVSARAVSARALRQARPGELDRGRPAGPEDLAAYRSKLLAPTKGHGLSNGGDRSFSIAPSVFRGETPRALPPKRSGGRAERTDHDRARARSRSRSRSRERRKRQRQPHANHAAPCVRHTHTRARARAVIACNRLRMDAVGCLAGSGRAAATERVGASGGAGSQVRSTEQCARWRLRATVRTSGGLRPLRLRTGTRQLADLV